jgi:hypothetical protein
MGSRGNRRRVRSTALKCAYILLLTILGAVGVAQFSQSQSLLRAVAAGAALGAVVAAVLVRHQLVVERAAHSEARAQLAQHYSRLTNARVVENAEFADHMHRRLDEVERDVAALVEAGNKHSADDAPTVVDLTLRALSAS